MSTDSFVVITTKDEVTVIRLKNMKKFPTAPLSAIY